MSRLVLFLVFALLLGRQITVAHSAVIVPADPDARLHLYGKAQPRPGRKMGHLTVLGTSPD